MMFRYLCVSVCYFFLLYQCYIPREQFFFLLTSSSHSHWNVFVFIVIIIVYGNVIEDTLRKFVFSFIEKSEKVKIRFCFAVVIKTIWQYCSIYMYLLSIQNTNEIRKFYMKLHSKQQQQQKTYEIQALNSRSYFSARYKWPQLQL